MHSKVTIGKNVQVNRIGLGTNRIRENSESMGVLTAAVREGVQFIDTASAYTNGESEKAIGNTLFPYNNIVVATKGGMVKPDFRIDSRPSMLLQQLENSLEKLKVHTIDIYFLHRVDPQVPLKESIIFLGQMQKEGKIKHIGLSEVSIPQIEEARHYVDIVAVENEYNVSDRSNDDVVSYCEREHIVFVPYHPLHFSFKDEIPVRNLQKKYNATKAQLGIAWLLKRSDIMLPIPGSTNIEHIRENMAACLIELSSEDFEILTNAS